VVACSRIVQDVTPTTSDPHDISIPMTSDREDTCLNWGRNWGLNWGRNWGLNWGRNWNAVATPELLALGA
jgi:hypothetical protein